MSRFFSLGPGFRPVPHFKRTMDKWMATFRACAPIDPALPVLIPVRAHAARQFSVPVPHAMGPITAVRRGSTRAAILASSVRGPRLIKAISCDSGYPPYIRVPRISSKCPSGRVPGMPLNVWLAGGPPARARLQGDPEWAAQEEREREGVPVKYAVLADLHDIYVSCAARSCSRNLLVRSFVLFCGDTQPRAHWTAPRYSRGRSPPQSRFPDRHIPMGMRSIHPQQVALSTENSVGTLGPC